VLAHERQFRPPVLRAEDHAHGRETSASRPLRASRRRHRRRIRA
jgi:hypothetical protein